MKIEREHLDDDKSYCVMGFRKGKGCGLGNVHITQLTRLAFTNFSVCCENVCDTETSDCVSLGKYDFNFFSTNL